MTAKDNDLELDSYLHGDSDLSRVYAKVGNATPPASLDTTILAASRRAVGSRPRLATSPFAVRTWGIPVSIAAVLMLSIGLINFMGEQEVGFDETSYTPKLRGGAEHSQSKDVSSSVGVDEAVSESKAKPASGLKRRLEIAPQAFTPQSAPASSQVSPGVVRSLEYMETKAEYQSDSKKPMTSQEDAVHQPGANAVRTRGSKQQRLRDEDRAASDVKAEQATGATSPAKKRAFSSGASLGSSVSKSGKIEDPTATLDTWLGHVRKLQREGRIEEARASLKAFRKRYPDYPITDEFAELN